MQLFADVALLVCGLARGEIGGDGVVPQAKAREDVRSA
jgi:hypothetical protein